MDPMMYLPLVLLAVMLVLMWRGNKQRAKLQEEMKAKVVVGADVMTQAGIYGTIVDIDEAANVTTIETTPGTRIRVHSMTIANVIEATVPDDASSLVADPAAPVAQAPAADADSHLEGQTPASGATSAESRYGELVEDGARELDELDGDVRRDGDAPRA
ncbi:hypothetical protein USB125703_01765 [Pseudoclavibacter triregionum]|nr:hypothetical protein USB125703_01765 [Pseudoclavibacter triregionum]